MDFGGDDLDDLLPVPLEVCILVKGDSKGKTPKKLETFVLICGVGGFLKWVVWAFVGVRIQLATHSPLLRNVSPPRHSFYCSAGNQTQDVMHSDEVFYH